MPAKLTCSCPYCDLYLGTWFYTTASAKNLPPHVNTCPKKPAPVVDAKQVQRAAAKNLEAQATVKVKNG